MAADYYEFDNELTELFMNEKYDEVLTRLDEEAAKFPEKEYEMTWAKGLCLALSGKADKAFDVLEAGQDKGFFYPVYPEDTVFSQNGHEKRFQDLLAANRELRLAKQKKVKPEYRIVQGEEGKNGKSLFIALHGRGENIDYFQERWHSPEFATGWDVIYVQSGQ
ncbi:MAG: hypothetical protein ACLFR1_14520, partial [Spirochaetia bacterium]